MNWYKVEFKDHVEENIDHEEAREKVNFLRWDMSNFDKVVFYTEEDVDDVLDEVFSLMKFDNVFVVFNYQKDNEYMVEV